LLFKGQNITKYNFSTRLSILQTLNLEYNNFIVLKPYYKFSDLELVYNTIYPFEEDGIIFQHDDKYKLSSGDQYIYKWKPKEKCSVDCRIANIHNGRCDMLFRNLSLDSTQQEIKLDDNYLIISSNIKVGMIVECIQTDKNIWQVLRIRNDKQFPNALYIAKTLATMEHITYEDFMKIK